MEQSGQEGQEREPIRWTRLEQALDWASSLAPAPWPIATSCCGMALGQGGDPFEALGTAPPPVAARSADLLIVAGSLTRRQVPLLRAIHARMLEPRWVMAWGVCAISGGAYQNYATVAGLHRILPVDVHVRGCPPAASDLREALLELRALARGNRGRSSRQGGWLPIEKTRSWARTSRASRPDRADRAAPHQDGTIREQGDSRCRLP